MALFFLALLILETALSLLALWLLFDLLALWLLELLALGLLEVLALGLLELLTLWLLELLALWLLGHLLWLDLLGLLGHSLGLWLLSHLLGLLGDLLTLGLLELLALGLLELLALGLLGHLLALWLLAILRSLPLDRGARLGPLGRELLGELFRSHLWSLLGRTGRLVLWQPDLLVDLVFLLFAPLFVLLRLLHELARLRITRLQFGLHGFVFSELRAMTLVCGALVGSTTLLAWESALNLSLLCRLLCSLLLALVLISLVAHSSESWYTGFVQTRLVVAIRTGDFECESNCST
ncbi:MAG: hypothetical protein ABEI77_04820 [Halorientalis sp.]